MKNTDIKLIQKVIYGILKDINEFCVQRHILYMLSGGSCLGAVRENGFIPWDDDADIMLPRKDYEIFLKKFADCYFGKYKVSSLYTDKLWARPYAKIWDIQTKVSLRLSNEENTGIGVDVFPLDSIPDVGLKRNVWFWKLKVLNIFRNSARRKGFYHNEKYISIKKHIDKFTRKKGARYYSLALEYVASRYQNIETNCIGAVLALNYWEKEICERDQLLSTVIMKFENDFFPVPRGYDRYLMNLYGDYMTPPDIHIDHSDVQKVDIINFK